MSTARRHVGQRSLELSNLASGRPCGRQTSSGRLDQSSELEHFDEEVVAGRRLEPPGEDVWIHEVPEPALAHLRPGLRASLHEALRGEDLHRLADDRPTDGLTTCVELARECVAGLQITSENAHPDVVHELSVQPSPRVRELFDHTITI